LPTPLCPAQVHLDGFNQLPYLKGEVGQSPRNYFFYVSDDGDLTAVRGPLGVGRGSPAAPAPAGARGAGAEGETPGGNE
jgi:hypothetical protein